MNPKDLTMCSLSTLFGLNIGRGTQTFVGIWQKSTICYVNLMTEDTVLDSQISFNTFKRSCISASFCLR